MGAWVYILRCSDGRYYVGSHRGEDVRGRVSQHNDGVYKNAWTYSRRPVELVWAEYFDEIITAIGLERQLKGWTRAKKEAVIRGDWDALPALARGRGRAPGDASSFDRLRMRLNSDLELAAGYCASDREPVDGET